MVKGEWKPLTNGLNFDLDSPILEASDWETTAYIPKFDLEWTAEFRLTFAGSIALDAQKRKTDQN